MKYSFIKSWLLVVLKKAGWAPIGLFILHVILSRIVNAYTIFPSTDIPMHFFGGVSIAYFLHHAYITAEKFNMLGNPEKFLYYLVIFSVTSTVTILWEFIEFIFDHLELSTAYFNGRAQVSLEDTLLDILLGMLGAAIVLLFFNKAK